MTSSNAFPKYSRLLITRRLVSSVGLVTGFTSKTVTSKSKKKKKKEILKTQFLIYRKFKGDTLQSSWKKCLANTSCFLVGHSKYVMTPNVTIFYDNSPPRNVNECQAVRRKFHKIVFKGQTRKIVIPCVRKKSSGICGQQHLALSMTRRKCHEK